MDPNLPNTNPQPAPSPVSPDDVPPPVSAPPSADTTPAGNPDAPKPPVPVKIKVPKINFLETQSLLADIEKKVGARVVSYYVPPYLSMGGHHAELFLDQLEAIGEQEHLALFLVTPGGDPTSALRIAAILRDYCKKLTILVPSMCASAGTILALSGDTIVMSAAGYLTAIDISTSHQLNPKGANGRPVAVSADQVKRILNFLANEGAVVGEKGEKEGAYRTLFTYLNPLVVGHLDRSSSASELIATKIMSMHPETFGGEEKIRYIAKHLVNDYPMHGFPIIYSEAVEVGLPVQKADKELSELMYSLVKVYSSTTIPAYTHFNPNHYHYDELSITLEAVGLRTARHNSWNKRFNPALRSWQTEEDNARWINIKPSNDPKKPFTITTIDVVEKEVERVAVASPVEVPTAPIKKEAEAPLEQPTDEY